MDRISSNLTISSPVFNESNSIEETQNNHHSSSSASVALEVGEIQLTGGGGVERFDANFSSQRQRETRNNELEEALVGIHQALVTAHHDEPSLEGILGQVETINNSVHQLLELDLGRLERQDRQNKVYQAVGLMMEDHRSLIRLINSSDHLSENAMDIRDNLSNDLDLLEEINQNSQAQPESKEERELRESKEDDLISLGETAERMRTALENSRIAIEFLRQNSVPVAQPEAEDPVEQAHQVGDEEIDLSNSDKTLTGPDFERVSLDFSEGTVDQSAQVATNRVFQNDPRFQYFIGNIEGRAHSQLDSYRFHVDNARHAEQREDFRGASMYWMSAVAIASRQMQAIDNHHEQNDNNYQNPEITRLLITMREQWHRLQNAARAAAQAANDRRCCVIA